ncbi:hypothetical protein BG015_010535 [Linnemannia schmuckeri]|uniref:GRIP domain-containing protein n=1 Tax=Linnemannia schmuckeri TaxID=64567 RepID=A0A9P5RTV0_9FUNG|nr:hypothetical protein BG015_010535 [Linnemannia schmuckeri]
MFNNLLKKASESSFAALASEALDSRPGSPASARRPPGSPLSGQQQQQQQQNGASTKKPQPSPHSTNAQLASQLDEAYNDVEALQKLLQKAAQEKSEIARNADLLKEDKEALNEELQEARAVIQAMRASLENKATDEFLSPKLTAQDGASETKGDRVSSIAATLDDPLSVSSGDSKEPTAETSDDSSSSVAAAVNESVSTVPASAPAPVSSASSTAITTALENTIKELKSQLSAKSEQCQSLEEALAQKAGELTKQKSDHDEKMKKMKAIFAAANKNLNEYRTSIAAKDEEITELKAKLENPEPTEEQANEQNQIVQDLEAELKSQSDAAAIKLQQMEGKYKQSNSQLEKLKVEYQQYKQRASALLQQQREAVQADDDSQLKELQSQLQDLARENKTTANELQEAELKRTTLEGELQLAMDQIASLESSHEISRRQERQHARQLKDLERSVKDAQRDREAAESRLASLQELRAVEAQSLMQELGGNTKHIEERLAKKEEENAELQKILDRLSDELAVARQEIQNLRDLVSSSESNVESGSSAIGGGAISAGASQTFEPEKNHSQLHISTTLGPRSSFSPFDQESPISRTSSSLSLPAERPPVYSTLSDLLAAKPLVERSPFGDAHGGLGTPAAAAALSSAREREYQIKLQHLTELLNESEANHQRLLDQEKVLKEEIRNLDRAERRQNLSVDYLKNIVLKYLETTDKEPLLPVLTTVLQLSPAEVASLRKKSVPPSASSMVLGGFFGGGGH